MRVTFIGHASILIEANGVRILSDPWWKGPCFGAQWWPYPVPSSQLVEGPPIDYVYISHGHHDHFHPPTLKQFPGAKILVGPGSELVGALRALGFEVIEAKSDELELQNGLRCRIRATYADDTFAAISDGNEVCINLNDALHAAPEDIQRQFCQSIRHWYGRPDYVFCGYGTASHFPNCYAIPGKDPIRTAARRQAHFNRSWARIIHGLSPRFGFPFAADVVFLDHDLFWCNEAVHNSERPTEVFERLFGSSTGVQVLDIAPGFVIEKGSVVQATVRKPLVADDLRQSFAEAIERVNRTAAIDLPMIRELKDMLAHNVAMGEAYFASYPADYTCLVLIKGASAGIRVEKSGRRISVEVAENPAETSLRYDIVYRTRASYLRQSLSTPYGHEILFVGSGGIFEFPDRSKVRPAIHRELLAMLKPFDPRATRRPHRPSLTGFVKRVLKRLAGVAPKDLYDLEKWTVFESGTLE